MGNKTHQEFVIPTSGGWSYVAIIRIHSGALATQSAISSISRSIYKLVNKTRVLVATDSIDKTVAVFDAAQEVDAVWPNTPYNFKDDVAATKVTSGERHLLQYTFTPTSGAAIKTQIVDLIPDVSLG